MYGINNNFIIQVVPNVAMPNMFKYKKIWLGFGGLFQQDNAPCCTANTVQQWFKELDTEFKMLTWPSNSPDFEHLWDVLQKTHLVQ